MARRLGKRLTHVILTMERADKALVVAELGLEGEAAAAYRLNHRDVGRTGLPDEEWRETFNAYGKLVLGILGERRRMVATMRGKPTPESTAGDSEEIITAIMLATTEEKAEAERRLAAVAKDGTPP